MCYNSFKAQFFLRDSRLSYSIRPMRKEDIAQVTEIDHEAFPTMWPPANYERELRTPLAHYIVAHEGSPTTEKTGVTVTKEKGPASLVPRVQQLLHYKPTLNTEELPLADKQYIVGFAGLWMMADEAHLTNIAVRRSHRQRGIGELLLISMIDLALELNAHILTLEVRASNISAQSLYYKYGLSVVNVRQGYYTNDKESALVMASEDITSAAFQEHLNRLKQAHADRWGIAADHITR
jgi:ribosomal-protein-alanine N-acetyltransferase